MTIFMKNEKLKKISQYIAMGLLWLVAMIGISAYAIYWCRQCANYSEPVQSVTLERRNSIGQADRVIRFKFKTIDYYNNWTYVYNSAVSGFYNDVIRYSSSLDHPTFYLDCGSVNAIGQDFSFGGFVISDCQYYTGSELEGWYFSQLAYANYNPFNWIGTQLTSYPVDNDANSSFNYIAGFSTLFNDTIYESVGGITLSDLGATLIDHDGYYLFSLFFDIIYDSYNSAMFEYDTNFNFSRMASEVVTSERLIVPYNNQFNGDPSDEFIQFYYKVDFMSNGELYHGVWLKLNKPIYIYKDSLMQVNFVGSLSQLQVVQVLYMKNLPSSLGDNGEMWADNSDNYTIVANKHIIRYESYDDGQTERQVAVYDYKQYDWVNQSYRVCYFDLSQYNDAYQCYKYPNVNSMFNSRLYQGLTLYQVLNNGFSDYNYITNVYTDNGTNLNLVFDLYRGAFSGLSALMSISVIPGVTLGLLFFAPFLVTAIIVIVRLVRG